MLRQGERPGSAAWTYLPSAGWRAYCAREGRRMTSDPGAVGAPNFDVVLRGYDRKQVDEHVGRLQRVMSRMRADLDMARSHPIPIVPPPGAGRPGGPPPRPTPRPRPGLPPQQ